LCPLFRHQLWQSYQRKKVPKVHKSNFKSPYNRQHLTLTFKRRLKTKKTMKTAIQRVVQRVAQTKVNRTMEMKASPATMTRVLRRAAKRVALRMARRVAVIVTKVNQTAAVYTSRLKMNLKMLMMILQRCSRCRLLLQWKNSRLSPHCKCLRAMERRLWESLSSADLTPSSFTLALLKR